jgi:MerR family transcriptional regulator/heat shock protein HspR
MAPKVRRIRIVPGVAFPLEFGVQTHTKQETSQLPVPTEASAQRHEPDTNVEDEASQGVYVISVTARILHMHPQTLRKYERLGLVNPSRSGGQIRYYSDLDISRLRMIKHLVEDRGMNLAGVELALEMVNRLQLMQQIMATQLGTDGQNAIQQLMTSVLDLLHYSDQDLRSVEPRTQV